MKDVFSAKKTNKDELIEAKHPNQYHFEQMLKCITHYKDVVKYFHNHHAFKAKFRNLWLSGGTQTLIRAAKTP